MNFETIWNGVVDWVLMNNSHSDSYWSLLLLEGYHQNSQTLFAAVGMNGLNKLTLSMLTLFSSKAKGGKDFWEPSKPCHVGIHWKALAEPSQKSTHLLGFQSFFLFFASFCVNQNNHQQPKGYTSQGQSSSTVQTFNFCTSRPDVCQCLDVQIPIQKMSKK